MNCFPCCGKNKKCNSMKEDGFTAPQETTVPAKAPDAKKPRADEQNQADPATINAQNFTFRELATATKNFRQECLLGEGGFGRVYKGIIPSTGKVIAVKQLDRHGMENSKEFLAEVASLSLLHHENLVDLIGYCADGDQRLLVYEYFPGTTLEDRLFENKPDKVPLSWFDRMKVAAGASKGLEFLHDTANPPVIYRDLKAFNILIDADFNAKLYDFGMAKFGGGDKMSHAPPRVMGTYGYCAPEYVRTGQFSLKSDVYSFGVVLLELITGRRAVDTTRPNDEQNLVSWAQPLFRDPKKYPDMADPLLNKNFPEKDLNQVVAIVSMCLQEEADARPLIGDVVTAFSFLSAPPPPPVQPSPLPTATSVSKESEGGSEKSESESESGSEDEGSEHEGNGNSQKHVAASAKFQDDDVSDIGNDHAHKNKNQPQHNSSSKSRSRNERSSDSGGDGISISNSSSNKSSRKWKGLVGNLSQKMSRKSGSKKSSRKELSQKSSKKSSKRELSHKSSGKPSARVLSHKSSMGADGVSVSSNGSGSSSCYSSSFVSDRSSSRLLSHGTESNFNSRREESMRLDMGSDDGGSSRYFNHRSSCGSER